MAYADKKEGTSKLTSVLLVVLLHIGLLFGATVAFNYEAIQKAVVDTVAINVEEPPEPEDLPPPPDIEPMETPPPPITAPPTPFTPPSPNPLRPPPPQEKPSFTEEYKELPPQRTQCADGSSVAAGLPCPKPPEMKQCPDGGPRILASEQCPVQTQKCPGGQVIPKTATCPAVGKSSKLSPRGNSGSWVPVTAYPRDALRDGIEGVVGFRLEVSAEGRPTSCSVTASSGNASLDKAACDNLMKRARFDPELRNGEKVPSSYSNRVRWQIPKK